MRSSHSLGRSLPKWPCLALTTWCTNDTPVGLLIEHPTFLRLHGIRRCEWWSKAAKNPQRQHLEAKSIQEFGFTARRILQTRFDVQILHTLSISYHLTISDPPLPSASFKYRTPSAPVSSRSTMNLGHCFSTRRKGSKRMLPSAISRLPHSSPGSSACCIRALGMGPKHHNNGMQWHAMARSIQKSSKFQPITSKLWTTYHELLRCEFFSKPKIYLVGWGRVTSLWFTLEMSLRNWAKKNNENKLLSCLLVKCIFNSTSEPSSASSSHWTGHLDI